VSEQNTAWFHCGRCGSLFRALIGESVGRQCGECGRDPAIGLTASKSAPQAGLPAPRRTGESADGDKRAARKREKANLLPLKLVVGWVVMLGLLVWWFRASSEEEKPSRPVAGATPAALGMMSDEAAEFINRGAHGTHAALVGFLSSGSPEARAQFVFEPAATVWKMTRFYEQNPLPNIDPGGLLHLVSDVVELPEGRGVLSQWRTAESRQIETLARQQGDEWLIDWEHFSRYSDYPWALFLAGGGEDDVGEFRLLAHQRLADERGPDEPLSVVFHAPRFGEPGQLDRPSPEFLLDPQSAEGKLFDEAFERRRSDQSPPTAIAADPSGMIRVRVVVRRMQEGDARRFELVEVRATDWNSPVVPPP
jgi:hypothetical protein